MHDVLGVVFCNVSSEENSLPPGQVFDIVKPVYLNIQPTQKTASCISKYSTI